MPANYFNTHSTYVGDVFQMKVSYYDKSGCTEIDVTLIDEVDAAWLEENNIKVSMERLSDGMIVVYGCPRSDPTEESEVLVFAADGKTCKETMRDLTIQCKAAFGWGDECTWYPSSKTPKNETFLVFSEMESGTIRYGKYSDGVFTGEGVSLPIDNVYAWMYIPKLPQLS